jgi:malate dehydrogenase
MICMGEVFGKEQPVALQLLDIDAEFALKGLNGLVLELEDCDYPLLTEVLATTQTSVAFKDVDYCVMCGAFPRKQGMERKDLLEKNAGIFREQGLAIKQYAKPGVKCLVVGNPANTNAWLLRHYGELPPKNVTALTRLDQNRARNMVARKVGVSGQDVSNVIIWGNHSATQYADVSHATVLQKDGSRKPAREVLNDDEWVRSAFVTDVQQRGQKVISTRGSSSATSAARAIVDHLRDWHNGTRDGEWVSMGVWSDGNSYGFPEGLVYSMPCVCKNGDFHVVEGLPIDEFSREQMDKTAKELEEERATALEVTKQ